MKSKPSRGILYNRKTLLYTLTDTIDEPHNEKVIAIPASEEAEDVLSTPVRVYYEFTRACNLACRHCFTGSSPTADIGMSTETVVRMLEDLKRLGVINVRFTGGEPVFREDWFEVLKYAKNLGLVTSLASNGVYDDPEETTRKIASLDLDQVTFSIDGLKETHDWFRGEGAFERTMTAAALLKKAGVNLRFTTVLTRKNVAEAPQLVELASHYVTMINFVYMRFVGRGTRHRGLSLTFEEHIASACEINALQEKYPQLVIVHSGLPLAEQIRFSGNGNVSALDFALLFGTSTLSIAADGTVWPHHYCAHQGETMLLGKYPHDSLQDIWMKSTKLRSFREWAKLLLERCGGCTEFKTRCAGINFEMELARMRGDAVENPFCINKTPIPPFPLMDLKSELPQ